MKKVGLLVRLHAKPGQEEQVSAFLQQAAELAEKEAGTPVWVAFQLDAFTFGIFDFHHNPEDRQRHLEGEIAATLMANAETWLSAPPEIEWHDVLSTKITL